MKPFYLVVISGVVVIVTATYPISNKDIGEVAIKLCIYFAYLLTFSIYIYAVQEKFEGRPSLFGAVLGIVSIGWAWGLVSGSVLPENLATLVAACFHAALFSVYPREIAKTSVGIRPNWKQTAEQFRRKVKHDGNAFGLTLFVLFLASIPALVRFS